MNTFINTVENELIYLSRFVTRSSAFFSLITSLKKVYDENTV